VNYAGVGLIVFGMLLLLAEVKVASHGILSVGGVISFVMGALMLTDVALAPAMRVSWQVLMVVTMLVAGFFLIVVGAAIRAHLRKVQTGVEAMRQAHGRALDSLRPAGEVLVEGERWRARALEGESIAAGDEIEVVGEEGLTLFVRARRATPPGPQGRGTGAG
jgi:membrane-bound serine protease (ClpP class)